MLYQGLVKPMKNKTILLLTPYKDLGEHRLAGFIGYLKLSVPFDECVYQPLKKLFSKVILYDYLEKMTEIGISAMNQEIMDIVEKERPDYVFWVAFGEYYEIRETTFLAIKKAGSKLLAWFFDDEVRFGFYSRWWTPYIDYFLTNDPDAVAKYRALGAWVTFAIPDTGEPTCADWQPSQEKYDVSFVGSLRADREDYITAIKNEKIPVSLFGLSFGNFVSYAEMSGIFYNSKINLNFSRTYSHMKFGVKGRIFKVCEAGGFLLTEYFPSLEEYFVIGKEVECFRDKKEMIEKIHYYLGHDTERRAIARSGWERACSQHTASHIVARIFSEIEQTKLPAPDVTHDEPVLPAKVRKRMGRYYKTIALAFFWLNYRGLWKDAFGLSLHYDPYNISARVHNIIGMLPSWPRARIITMEMIMRWLIQVLFKGLGRVPYLRKIKRELTLRLSRGEEGA
jgi:spore maturation protein CgeB